MDSFSSAVSGRRTPRRKMIWVSGISAAVVVSIVFPADVLSASFVQSFRFGFLASLVMDEVDTKFITSDKLESEGSGGSRPKH